MTNAHTLSLPIHAHDDGVVAFIRLQRQLLLWLELVCLQLLDLTSKHLGGFSSRVNTISLCGGRGGGAGGEGGGGGRGGGEEGE